jgi:hypothetical protein
MRRAAIISMLLLSTACASSGRFDSLTLSSLVQIHAAHGLIRPEHRVEGSEYLGLLQDLVAHAKATGHRVVAADLCEKFADDCAAGDVVWGFHDDEDPDTIWLERTANANMMAYTLAHELGHHYQPAALNQREANQVFADAVAVLVCRGAGLDVTSSSIAYLYGQHVRDLWVLQYYRREIDAAAAAINKDVRR